MHTRLQVQTRSHVQLPTESNARLDVPMDLETQLQVHTAPADSAAVAASDGSIWMGTEYIPNAPRTPLANWGTYLINYVP